ncbi:MAG: hypothetical protein QJT81_14015 [Candidatus Thiothrix putei]|uniref:Uncharacterized protein n=1 Tax=Candidatus Thiothrix putei TaxID=3080811 RepID=A0AA95HBG8_9GAMM|nr:MAG: hypothetical protein QJT81_14015 [Candidatus Thiothrix putei]
MFRYLVFIPAGLALILLAGLISSAAPWATLPLTLIGCGVAALSVLLPVWSLLR